MKRLLLLAVCIASVATAQAQDYYAEEYIKSSPPRLSSKLYVSQSNGVYKERSETYDPGMGIPVRADEIPLISITRMEGDSVKIYSYNQKVKTYRVMALAVPKGGKLGDIAVNGNSMADMAKRAGVTSPAIKREFLGMENINGYDCHHYRHTSDDGGYNETWVYEPRGITMQRMEGHDVFYLANIQDGAQPESLFQLPADYKPQSGDLRDVNALMDMIQGKGKAGDVMKQTQDDMKKIDAMGKPLISNSRMASRSISNLKTTSP